MRYRTLGRTGLKVSELGLGCEGFISATDAEAQEMFQTALAAGPPTPPPFGWAVTPPPAEEWPSWSAPVGAHDAYSAGAKVSHGEKHWISDQDGNVWEPGVYGWTEAVEEPADGA